MRHNILFLFSILFFFSCSTNEEIESFHTTSVSRKVVRELTNEGIAGSKIYLKIVKTYGTGYFSYKKIIDSKEYLQIQKVFLKLK